MCGTKNNYQQQNNKRLRRVSCARHVRLTTRSLTQKCRQTVQRSGATFVDARGKIAPHSQTKLYLEGGRVFRAHLPLKAGLTIALGDSMPDVLLWNKESDSLWVIEAVCSDGEVDQHKVENVRKFNGHLARTYLSAGDPEIARRNWQWVMDALSKSKIAWSKSTKIAI